MSIMVEQLAARCNVVEIRSEMVTSGRGRSGRWVGFAVLGLLAWPSACGGRSREHTDRDRSVTAGEGGDESGTAGTGGASGQPNTGTGGSATAGTGGRNLGGRNGTGGAGMAGNPEAGGVAGDGGEAGKGDGGTGSGEAGTAGSPGNEGGAAGFACSDPVEVMIGEVPTGRLWCAEGYEVRDRRVTCPNLLPDKAASAGASGDACSSHADCPGALEYCQTGPFGGYCLPGCQSDDDCAPGSTCRCSHPIGQCSTSACTTNDDCSADSHCAAVRDPEEQCRDVFEYACQGVADECQSNLDCPEPSRGACTLVEGIRRCRQALPCR